MKGQFELFGAERKRKNFTTRTKKEEWRLSARTVTFTKKSKCRKCKRQLTWGDRTYEFDHKDNNPKNNSQKNCFLVCRICHAKATRFGTRREKGFLGETIAIKRTKKKVGYKKSRKKAKPRRVAIKGLFGEIVGYRTVKPRKKTATKKRTKPKRKRRKRQDGWGFFGI